MKIKAFLDDMKQLDPKMKSTSGKLYSELMAESQDIWSNAAAKGYAIRAAQDVGLTEQQIKELLNALRYAFDVMTVDEAEQVYRDF